MATPCFGMNTHVTSLERTQKAVSDNEVPFKVSKEDLQKNNVFIKTVINMLIMSKVISRGRAEVLIIRSTEVSFQLGIWSFTWSKFIEKNKVLLGIFGGLTTYFSRMHKIIKKQHVIYINETGIIDHSSGRMMEQPNWLRFYISGRWRLSTNSPFRVL